jgi:hypothetical protein
MSSSRRRKGGEAVSPAAVATLSTTSSSTAHASAAAADPPPPAFPVTPAMKEQALQMAMAAAAREGDDWGDFNKQKRSHRRDAYLTFVVAEARVEAEKQRADDAEAGKKEVEARLSARVAPGMLLSLLLFLFLMSHVGLVA